MDDRNVSTMVDRNLTRKLISTPLGWNYYGTFCAQNPKYNSTDRLIKAS